MGLLEFSIICYNNNYKSTQSNETREREREGVGDREGDRDREREIKRKKSFIHIYSEYE